MLSRITGTDQGRKYRGYGNIGWSLLSGLNQAASTMAFTGLSPLLPVAILSNLTLNAMHSVKTHKLYRSQELTTAVAISGIVSSFAILACVAIPNPIHGLIALHAANTLLKYAAVSIARGELTNPLPHLLSILKSASIILAFAHTPGFVTAAAVSMLASSAYYYYKETRDVGRPYHAAALVTQAGLFLGVLAQAYNPIISAALFFGANSFVSDFVGRVTEETAREVGLSHSKYDAV